MRFGIREVVFLLVLMAVPVASFWFVFQPQNAEIEQAKKEIAHKEQMLEKLSAVTEKTHDLRAANEEIRERIELIEARLPSRKEVDVILDQVADLAVANELSLEKVKSGQPVEAASYMEQPLEMEISGSFEGFYSFLLDVERLDRITRMPQLEIERSDDVDGAMEATFTLSIYFQSAAAGGSA